MEKKIIGQNTVLFQLPRIEVKIVKNIYDWFILLMQSESSNFTAPSIQVHGTLVGNRLTYNIVKRTQIWLFEPANITNRIRNGGLQDNT